MITAKIKSIIKYGEGLKIDVYFSDDTEKSLIFSSETTSDEIKAKITEIKAEKELLIDKIDYLSNELLNIEL